MPKVYNKYKNPPKDAVYIGRGSMYGNPFPDDHKPGSRDIVCNKYEAMIEADPAKKALFIENLRGKNLVCFCAPKRCHGDYLLRIANIPSFDEWSDINEEVLTCYFAESGADREMDFDREAREEQMYNEKFNL